MILPLRLEGVTYRDIIKPLSLELAAGPSTIILGANGAGKSVLMRLMHGLLQPNTGTISWSSAGRQAMVFQRPVMLRRSALANVAYALEVSGTAHAEKIALETSKGDLPLALALGAVLISIVLALNAAAFLIKEAAQRRYG